MTNSLPESLLERHFPLLKKVILLALLFSIGVFVLTLVIVTVLKLSKIQGYEYSLKAFFLFLSFYCYFYCVLTAVVLLLIIVVYGKIKRLNLELARAEIVICVLAILAPGIIGLVLKF